MKTFIIYHPQTGTNTPAKVERKTYDDAKAEYKRLQDIYPSREMCLVAVNNWGDRARIHEGRWD